MRQRSGEVLTANQMLPLGSDPSVVLDEDEQEQLVQTFEAANALADRTWRVCFGVVTLGLILFFLQSAYWQLATPWSTKYHAPFRQVTQSHYVVMADVIAASAFGALLLVLLRHAKGGVLFIGGYVAALWLTLFWMYNLSKLGGRTRWDLMWLPFAVPIYSLLVVYIERTFANTRSEIAKLRSSMYNFKAL